MAYSTQQALEYLERARDNGRLAHAYLVTGQKGCGKRQFAAGFAALIHHQPSVDWPIPPHPDIHIVEPELKSRRISIDQIRTLEHSLQLRPASAPRKIAVVTDTDRLTVPASNAFLKTLEEPPPDSHILLLSAHPEMLLETVVSRCLKIPLIGGARPAPDARAREVLGALQAFSDGHAFGVRAILVLAGRLREILGECKETLQREAAEELRIEVETAADSAEREWVELREEHYEALAEARYQMERARLIELLPAWWADALKNRFELPSPLDIPSHAESTARLAAALSTPVLLRILAHLETLRDHLFRTNVREPLAIEVALLNVSDEIAAAARGPHR